MKIFITGSNGFIGQHIVDRLKDKHELIHLKYDLRDHTAVKKQLIDSDPEIIVHLAAKTEVQDSFYEQATFSEVNYIGTINLIESAKNLKNLKNFVFASTMEVYGWQPIIDFIENEHNTDMIPAFDENTQTNPNSPYGLTKLACEKYLEYAHRIYNLPFTVIRQTNAYGRKDNTFFVTEQIIYHMLTNPNEILLGCGSSYRNFIYIEDLLDAWQTIIENPEKCIGEIFCLGPDNAVKISKLVDMIAQKIRWNGTVTWNTKPPRPGEVYLLNSTNAKITEKTGWSPKYTLDRGLDKTIADWRNIISNNLPFKHRIK